MDLVKKTARKYGMEYKVGETIFNDWTIIREIGSGISGQVWEISKKNREESISSALKVIRIPGDSSSLEQTLYEDGMDEESVMEFFQSVVDELTDEIKLMAEMKDSPHIVKCEDYKIIRYPGEIKWDILIRMELLTPLQVFSREVEISEADVLRMSKELVQTLELFEDKRIIHRDIKPANIFTDNQGNFKIGDFGIARVWDKVFGDPYKKKIENYMAPEVLQGKIYDHAADIYSLGLVLYKLLNKDQFSFYSATDFHSEIDRQQQQQCNTAPKIGQIILKMCAYDLEVRYQDAHEILTDLEAITEADKSNIAISKQSITNEKQEAEEKLKEKKNAKSSKYKKVGVLLGILFLAFVGIYGKYNKTEEPVVVIIDESSNTLSAIESLTEQKTTEEISYTKEKYVEGRTLSFGMPYKFHPETGFYLKENEDFLVIPYNQITKKLVDTAKEYELKCYVENQGLYLRPISDSIAKDIPEINEAGTLESYLSEQKSLLFVGDFSELQENGRVYLNISIQKVGEEMPTIWRVTLFMDEKTKIPTAIWEKKNADKNTSDPSYETPEIQKIGKIYQGKKAKEGWRFYQITQGFENNGKSDLEASNMNLSLTADNYYCDVVVISGNVKTYDSENPLSIYKNLILPKKVSGTKKTVFEVDERCDEISAVLNFYGNTIKWQASNLSQSPLFIEVQ